jgi:peptidoglycan-associated lipoprotein
MLRTISLILAGSIATIALAGCAKKPPAKDASDLETTSGRMKRANVNVSDELAKVCNITLGNVSRAPKFDFDEAALLPEDRDILEQVAKCVTTGPLKGRGLSLVGRADPRGETEYNLVLGTHRAECVRDYLFHLGVAEKAIAETSRGEFDAEGKDEDGWRRDRRVDVSLR